MTRALHVAVDTPRWGFPRRDLRRAVDGGQVGTSARHHELGPIALALLKRNIPVDAPLLTDGIDAAQEIVVDPEVGLHVRPLR